ncbi:hypothetical protein OPV22_013738 [Ensete ventricosum]|uniref:DUF7036 domain-containing protein n=1 Tax=Ensete ventricosum TaxID=4639 RepID=A0AAV8R661_ENSVE|nr:hypothetical protein OPV22_013738 [Ensete ventricosum]
MGKSEEEQPAPAPPTSPPEASEGSSGSGFPRCRSIGRAVRPRCVAALIFGLAVLLSAVFWLPPFVKMYGSHDRGSRFTAEVVASFRLQKPVALLNANVGKLQFDIFEEIGVPDSSVAVIYLEPLGGSNWTNVVFGVWPYPRNSALSTTGLSILRESFMSLVVRQSTLHLTASLFGNSWFFEVLKFPGGITIIPPQRAFLLQKVQMLFNFTLNFSIDQVQHKVSELKDQMKAGLLLNSNENLYVRLTNLEGSTVAPPTIVQTSIILAVGNRQPSLPRWKELAQTIRNSSAGNLGLNHTVFGRVKQIPPQPAYQSPSPSGCRYGFSSKPRSKGYLAPAAAPVDAPKHSSAPAAAPVDAPKHSSAPAAALGHSTRPASAPQHLLAPRAHENSPVLAPNMNPPSPSPAVSFTHVQPRSEGITDNKPPDRMPSISPAPYSSFASGKSSVHLLLAPLLYVILSC